MNDAFRPARGWPWGLLALLAALLAWAALLGAGLAFAASVGAPGDGNQGMQAMQGWILAALTVLVVAAGGSAVAIVLAGWRRRGRRCAAVAALLLVLMLCLVLIIAGSIRGPALATADQAIWQQADSRG